MKLAGAALVLFACTLIGLRVAQGYRDRPKALRQLLQALIELQSEVEYHATPIPQALRAVGTRLGGWCGSWLVDMANVLSRPADSPEIALQNVSLASATSGTLRDADAEPFLRLLRSIAVADRDHLQQPFLAARADLEAAIQAAQDEAIQGARLWQYLGALAGVFIVLLLL
ncbi:stage III sporulation protein AB [Alicyclobacillus acidocaldarius]|uniref:Sporulation stage III protein AB n=1 Tax=Alicyclobacillus acidocaldarius subsp. acidocaldarius (strain ATCC 27009 / DSM 446 / BCRC 14685 / JCM 5260 / KCTC 1825 / NBRC 15652 / NCIMB 11725 / NRRL B-14509 / 104-IA) TaxID=521098 RepID=C8WXI3_ALIAD|nr:stage III sporulation protein AB [Alicyclobacillus acidocaldarius]ACV58804.1 Sporulation stage III protein AB [Alicyclobacillus acidocaldarius subsp. acidocaldarius DSM 446]